MNSRGRLHAAVEEDRADEALEDVGQDRGRGSLVRAHPLAHDQVLVEPSGSGDLGAGPPRHDDRLDPGQLPFLVLRELAKQQFADDRAQDRVAQELEPLVGGQPMVGPRGVRERLAEQGRDRGTCSRSPPGNRRAVGIRPGGSSGACSNQGFAQGIASKSFRLSPALRVVNRLVGMRSERARCGPAPRDRARLPAIGVDECGTLAGSFRPGADSTPLATSTIQGRTARSVPATFSGVKPARQDEVG